MEEMNDNRWPKPPPSVKDDPQLEFKKLRYQAKLQVVAARELAEIEKCKEHFKASTAYEYACQQALYSAYLDIAKGQLDRSRARAEFIEKAASVIGAAYGVILGLRFSISKDINLPPPIRSLVSPSFLALSITLAAIYLAYITPVRSKPSGQPSKQDALVGRRAFTRLTTQTVLRRISWLQSAIISLGFGVLFLPIAFLTNIQDNLVWAAVAASVLIVSFPLVVALRSKVKYVYWYLNSHRIWPKTPEGAAALFGGDSKRWRLSMTKPEWYLRDGDSIPINTHGMLA